MTNQPPQFIVLMGVSGCGKTTVGRRLAQRTGIPYRDGDDFHSEENRAKMARSEPLGDADRQPWLQAIVEFSQIECTEGRSLLMACSALKLRYRDQLRSVGAPVKFVHLVGSIELIEVRLSQRSDHFMPKSLLQSQFDILEPPLGEAGVIEVSIEQEVDEIVDEVVHAFGLC